VARGLSGLKAAFLLPGNLAALLTALGSAALTQDALPAWIALGLEATYLGLSSLSPRLRRALGAPSWGGQADEEDVVAQLEQLAPSQQEHYFALRELRDHLLANYRKLPGGKVIAASSEQRLDALLANFLRLLSSLNSYRAFLSSAAREELEAEIASLDKDAQAEENPRVQEVKEKRLEILRKRLQRYQQAQESREVVSHQLASIEDLLRLTHEQSIAIRDPAALTRQLDVLTHEVEATDETVRAMEQFMEFDELLSTPGDRTGVRV
jgi:hypothetical protein